MIIIFLLIFSTCHCGDHVWRETSLGRIIGWKVDAVTPYESFLGVPYALPPVAGLRFLPPLPGLSWQGDLPALVSPPSCPQLNEDQLVGEEDCLFLNIYTPAEEGEKLPVMVWIHGGRFTSGSGSDPLYGPELLVNEGVVVVSINYRLGALGWLTTLSSDAPGNLGLRDMALALTWVRDNIGDYGGDGERVTVFGTSAGSMAISALLTMGEAGGPFQRAVLQSGTLARPFFLQGLGDDRLDKVREFGEHLSCEFENLVDCLRAKSVKDLVEMSAVFPPHSVWQPVLDSVLGEESILASDPLSSIIRGNFRPVDLIIGSNTGDGISQLGRNVLANPNEYDTLQKSFKTAGTELLLGKREMNKADIVLAERLRYFYMGEARMDPQVDKDLVELMTDNMYQAGGRRIADYLRQREEFGPDGAQRLFQYIFSYVGSVTNTQLEFNLTRPELGACHGDELFYIFQPEGDSPLITEEDQSVSSFMAKAWTQFAKTGNPNFDTELWPQLSASEERYLKIDATINAPSLPPEYARKTTVWETILAPNLPERETTLGRVRGGFLTSVTGSCITSFQGIPYAAPPVGNLRFLDTQPALPWVGVLQATEVGNKCPQDVRPYDDPLEAISEDCLYLNVYAPCDNPGNLPVMVWVHGGASRRGSGGSSLYGPEYLLDSGIVLVTINYRLIPFGFITMESGTMPGNQGHKDQVMAFKWIQANIRNFGGNPDEVTIFGESAGSMLVLSHLVSPLSAGLFSRVIAQSGSPTAVVPTYLDKVGTRREALFELATSLNCAASGDEEVLQCLQGIDTESFYEAASSVGNLFGLVRDADFSSEPFMPMWPEAAMRSGEVNAASVVIGFNKDEGIYQIPSFILDPDALPNLNENFDTWMPQRLFGKCCHFSQAEIEKATQVREFYFGGKNVSLGTIHTLIDFFTDQTFWMPAHRAVTFLSSHPTLHVYEYLFTHQGAFGYADMIGLQNYSLGVAHADDLHYLFNGHGLEFPALEGEDFTVRDIFVNMWTNFAKSGDPTSSPNLGFQWSRFEPESPQYLDINSSPMMDYSSNFQRRVNFWDKLFPMRPLVRAPVGSVLGSWGRSEKGEAFKSFRGIPYGKVTQRFMAADPAEPWGEADVLEAHQERDVCPQHPGRSSLHATGMSEDCLHLNVFVPGGEELADLPVMVWIHGGAYVGGSGGDYYYGPEFLMDKGLILVTINYRLGALGFLNLRTQEAPGNAALWDQHLALTWVQQNIRAFGGDPGKVTIAGESAGSFSVMYHLVSPASKGLFRAVIAQSGSPFSTYWSPDFMAADKPRRVATALAESFDCEISSDETLMTCLRQRPWSDFIWADVFCKNGNICTVDPWNAVVDDYMEFPFLPDTPHHIALAGDQSDVPLLIGVNSEEGIYLVAKYIKDPAKLGEINDQWESKGPQYIFDSEAPTEAMQSIAQRVKTFYLGKEDASMENIHKVIDMFSDIIFWAGPHRYIKLAGRQNSPIYQYLLTAKSSNSFSRLSLGLDDTDLGVCHADDLYHLFKNHVHNMTFNEGDLMLREFFLNNWSSFVKSGEPGGNWLPVLSSSPEYMNISFDPHMESGQDYRERMEFWMTLLDEIQSIYSKTQ